MARSEIGLRCLKATPPLRSPNGGHPSFNVARRYAIAARIARREAVPSRGLSAGQSVYIGGG
jgi:hypothetical protein